MSALSEYPVHQQVSEVMLAGAQSHISVVVVDDHELVAESLASALGDEPDLRAAGVATTFAAALELVARVKPEVVVVNYRLPDEDGIEAARRIRQLNPEVMVVLLTAVATEGVLDRAMGAGCAGAATKGVSVDDLSRVIRSVAHGERAVAGDFESKIRLLKGGGSRRTALLSAREQEVLRAVSLGHSTTAIAQSLRLSEYTVRNHVRNILTKLNAHTKLEAVIQAARAGILTLDD